MSVLFPIFIAAIVFLALIGNMRKQQKKKQNFMKSAAAKGVGGVASLYFLEQLMEHHQIDEHIRQQMEQMNLQQMQDFALQHDLTNQMELQQMMENSMNPYQNPGLDIVVDESFHGIDHGTDHSMHDHGMNDHHHNNF